MFSRDPFTCVPEVARDSEAFASGAFSELLGDVSVHAAASPSSKPEDTANFRVDLQFTKVGRLFGPLHIPTYGADKIGFVDAIPCRCSDLCKEEPAQGCGEIGTGTCRGSRAGCDVLDSAGDTPARPHDLPISAFQISDFPSKYARPIVPTKTRATIV